MPLRAAHSWLTAGAFALAALFVVPLGMEARVLLAHEDDPAAIADRALDKAFDAPLATREIEAALEAKDADLARSFLELARDRHLPVAPELAARVKAAVDQENSTSAQAQSFARGFLSGEPDNMVGLAGTVAGDLFVFGDIRDAVREGSRYARGEAVDEMVLGLSVVGIAITAGTYATFGAGAPARVGLSAVKAARKAGKLSSRMAGWFSRSVREVIDWSALRKAGGMVAEPAAAARAAREAVKMNKANDLLRVAGNVGTVQTKAGTKAALDGLRIAQGPQDMAKIAVLAEKKGGKTRAILKTLGRGAIALSIGTFNLASWILGALLTMLGMVASAKSGVERMTQRSLDRRRARQQARYAAMTTARA